MNPMCTEIHAIFGPAAATDAIARLEDDDFDSVIDQRSRSRQSRQAGADNDDALRASIERSIAREYDRRP
jgi:hypothetical protein